jgi:lysophospholipase L1-like esterase
VGFSNRILVITFDSYSDQGLLERPGFGENFLSSRQIDALHVIPRDNRWYQYPELPEVASLLCGIAGNYARTITYGSSMGGYAAIRFAGAVGASAALAVSPQFSIDPTIVPFENRWLDDAQAIDFRLERSWSPDFAGTAYIVYDPSNIDARHVELFARRTRVIPVALHGAGHPCTGFLAEIGLLQPLVLEVAAQTFDVTAFVDKARIRRGRSALFMSSLADRCRDPERQVRLRRRAVELAPLNPAVMMRYGLALCRTGRIAEARKACEEALAQSPDDPVRLCEYSEFLIRIHHWERADAVIGALVDRWPASPPYQSRLKLLRSLLNSEYSRAFPVNHSGLRWTNRILRAGWLFPPRDVRPRRRSLPIELRVTTVPSPPPFAASWRRHLELLKTLPSDRLDLLMIGDSLIQYWPGSCFGNIKCFNFGIAGDKTQHALWRLRQLRRGQLRADRVLLMLGTNNLGDGDGPEAICAGIRAVARQLRRLVPAASCFVIELPPCGPEFSFNSAVRLRANELLRSASEFRSINVDEVITTGFSPGCRNYLPDRIHWSNEGYRVLTRHILAAIAADERSSSQTRRPR